MNETLTSFLDELTMRMPDIKVRLDPGVTQEAPVWLDLRGEEKSATIEYRPMSGFGLYADEVDEYGTGPTEIYRAVEPLLVRLSKHFGSPPSGSLGLRDLRELRSITQEQLGELAGKKQSAISKIEARDELLLGTLVEYVKALGGNVLINVHFKDFDVPISVPSSNVHSDPPRAGAVAWMNRPAHATNEGVRMAAKSATKRKAMKTPSQLDVQWSEGPLLYILRQQDEIVLLQLKSKPPATPHVSAQCQWLHWFDRRYELTLRDREPATWDVALSLRSAQLLVARMTAEIVDKKEGDVLPWVS